MPSLLAHDGTAMKTRLEDLAVFGGPAAFSEHLHVGRPNIGDRKRLLDRIDGLLNRRWLTNRGPLVREFEAEIARVVGVKHCIATCSGTLALEIAARAAGLSGEVIVPSFTFVATPHALQWQQITPVFCDIDPRTHNIDPGAVETLITPQTTGIVGVHLWGRACNVEALTAIAARHDLRLLFDAAHAFGCSHQGTMIGNFGDAEVFSFHSTKWLNSFEGGAVVTNDDALAATVRLMGHFGFQGVDDVVSIGTNAKMTEVAAAMGLASLESADAFRAANRRTYLQYQEQLQDIPGVSVMRYGGTDQYNFQYIVLEIDEKFARLTRDQLHRLLQAERSLVRRYFYPGCHRMEPYRTLFPDAGRRLPHTEALADRILLLPNAAGVGEDDVTVLCAIIRWAVQRGDAIKEKLAAAQDEVHPAP